MKSNSVKITIHVHDVCGNVYGQGNSLHVCGNLNEYGQGDSLHVCGKVYLQ